MLSPAEILSGNGPLAGLIDGFNARPQQQAMAEAIAAAIAEHESIICEAGTGTGKTFAYLVPIMLAGVKTIISTGTKHLQDQLFLRDFPIIQQALNVPVHVSLLKGRGNYLCLHRMQLAEQDNLPLSKKGRSQLLEIKQWSQQTVSGDLSELVDLPEDASIRFSVTSTTENCLGQECSDYKKCFVFKARQHANDADVVIVNHHLFFADLALRGTGYGELLPVADIVVFDEAHKLPELASDFFSRTLSSRQLLELITDTKAAYFAEAADLPELLELLSEVEKSVRSMRLSFGHNDRRTAWQEIKDDDTILDALNQLIHRFHDLHHILEEFAARGKQLDNCFKRLNGLFDVLDDFIERGTNEQIQWLETRGQGFFLHETPLNIAEAYQKHMADLDCSVVYTSATLAMSKDFSYFSDRLGLQEVNTTVWDSPFDYQQQALLYIPQDLPDPRMKGYTEKVVENAIPVINYANGRTFFLFTSYRALRIAAEIIQDKIIYPVLVQGDAPKTELLETFRAGDNSVLLGTSSFWEGVDVKGQALSCVIIDKLPFASPDDPVLQARLRKLEEQGGNPFMEYQIPEAVIALKQGIGRLIRDKDDYGVLMICDPRLTSKSYGKKFLRSLPDMKRTNKLEDIRGFYIHR